MKKNGQPEQLKIAVATSWLERGCETRIGVEVEDVMPRADSELCGMHRQTHREFEAVELADELAFVNAERDHSSGVVGRNEK